MELPINNQSENNHQPLWKRTLFTENHSQKMRCSMQSETMLSGWRQMNSSGNKGVGDSPWKVHVTTCRY